MSRYSPPVKIHAPHWDADEHAWIKTKLSFGAGQRISYHSNKIQAEDVASLELAEESAAHLASALIEMLDKWTLRTPAVPYAEGVDRPIWDITIENILEQPLEDVVFIFAEGMKVVKAIIDAQPTDLLTETARAEGQTPEDFPVGDTTRVAVPRLKAVAAS